MDVVDAAGIGAKNVKFGLQRERTVLKGFLEKHATEDYTIR